MRDTWIVAITTPVTADEPLVHLVDLLKDGTVLVEPAWPERDSDEDGLFPFRTLSGATGSDRLWTGADGSPPPHIFREADGPVEGARAARCYERVGSAVSLSILVEGAEEQEALERVKSLLAQAGLAHSEPSARPALDMSFHYLTNEGRPIASNVPHWQPMWFSCLRVAADRPIEDAVWEAVHEREQRMNDMRSRSAKRGAKTRRQRGTQGGGRGRAFDAETQARAYDDDRTLKYTREELAARYKVSVPTLLKYLRAEQEIRDRADQAVGASVGATAS